MVQLLRISRRFWGKLNLTMFPKTVFCRLETQESPNPNLPCVSSLQKTVFGNLSKKTARNARLISVSITSSKNKNKLDILVIHCTQAQKRISPGMWEPYSTEGFWNQATFQMGNFSDVPLIFNYTAARIPWQRWKLRHTSNS